VPFMNQSFYKILLLFMVSLAVGVLSGSGVFHLIPHVSIFTKTLIRVSCYFKGCATANCCCNFSQLCEILLMSPDGLGQFHQCMSLLT